MNDHDIDTTKLEGALRGLAEHGPVVDEAAAWSAITAGIEAEARRSRRFKVLAGAGGAVAAGSIAAALTLLAGTDDHQAVDVGPAGTGDATTDTADMGNDHSTIEVELPEATLLAVGDDQRSLLVLDAQTGETVSSPYVADPGDTIWDATISRDGAIYLRVGGARGPASSVVHVAWDGSATATVSGFSDQVGDLAVSPDGAVLAASDFDPVTMESSIVLMELSASGDTPQVRHLGWRDDEPADRRTGGIERLAFSPDGTQLLFSAAQDSYDPIESFVLDVDALELSEARSLGTQVAVEGWYDRGILAVREVEPGGPGGVLAFVEGGPDIGVPTPPSGQVDSVIAGSGGVFLRVFEGEAAAPAIYRMDVATDSWARVDAAATTLLAASP